jgi:hypothetical protein
MFKILLIFILLLAFVAPLRRFLFWLIVGKQMVKEQKKYNQQNQAKSKPEGEIKVDFIPKDRNDFDKNGGQYVDFEEVKD